jgi:UDPglucose 6-dehydrogenase
LKITIYGVGYVGLVTGACLADRGHQVLCVDIDASKIALLQGGGIPIYEPGLEAIVARCVKSGGLRFSCDMREGVNFAELQMIAVGTPPDATGAPNLTFLLNVARMIGRYMTKDRIMINKSTVPVGTAERAVATARQALSARGLTLKIEAVSNPEFLKEGSAIKDFMEPDRVVIGVSSVTAQDRLLELYAPFVKSPEDILVMDPRSAEFTKYAANAMLATRISFMNEMSNLAECLGVDIELAKLGIGRDRRIGLQFLNPGCGYGGSCFPKDIQGIQHMAHNCDCPLPLLDAVSEVNLQQRKILFNKLVHHFGGRSGLSGRTIAVWGLSFKANTDDIRNSPAIDLVEDVLSAGATVQAYDPVSANATRNMMRNCNRFTIAENLNDSLDNASALVICTEWKEFREADMKLVRDRLLEPVIVDGRNLFEPADMEDAGLIYYGIGRGVSRYHATVDAHEIAKPLPSFNDATGVMIGALA